jgi:hypothetical protein
MTSSRPVGFDEIALGQRDETVPDLEQVEDG